MATCLGILDKEVAPLRAELHLIINSKVKL